VAAWMLLLSPGVFERIALDPALWPTVSPPFAGLAGSLDRD
jgi:hypothetical protein